MKKKTLLATLMLLAITCSAQDQLVVIRKQNVVKRFEIGDLIRYSLSDHKHFRQERVIELTDTTIITDNDTVAYYKVMLVDIGPQRKITIREIGFNVMAAGILLPIADLINVGVVQDEEYDFSSGIVLTAATLFTTGAIMYILDKPYFKLGHRNKLRIINRDSPLFFRSKPVHRLFDVPSN